MSAAAHIHLGQFEETHLDTVDSSDKHFTALGPSALYLVMASADICLRRNQAATTNDFVLLAGTYARVYLQTNSDQFPAGTPDTLHYTVAAGGTTATIQITQVTK